MERDWTSARCSYIRQLYTERLMLQLFINGVPIPADAFVRLLESHSVSLSPIAKDDLLKFVVTIDRNGAIQHHKPRKYYITDEVHEVAKLFYEQLNNSEQ